MGHSLCSFILRQIPRRSPTHNAVYFTTTRLGGYNYGLEAFLAVLKGGTVKLISAAQYGADITALRCVRRQLATDLTDYTGNCSATVLTIFAPYSFIDLMSGKYPTWMSSQICKD